MGNIWHTRANLLHKENPDYAWTWNENVADRQRLVGAEGQPGRQQGVRVHQLQPRPGGRRSRCCG